MACRPIGTKKAIVWNNIGILSIGPLEANLSEILIKMYMKIFIPENAFDNIVCEMAATLSRPQCVNIIGSCYDMINKTRYIISHSNAKIKI